MVHCLIVLYICSKFRKNISKAFRVTEQTGFVMDRQTDNYGKNNMSPPDGEGGGGGRWGRHKYES